MMNNLLRMCEVRKNLKNYIDLAAIVGTDELKLAVSQQLEQLGSARQELFDVPKPVEPPAPEPVKVVERPLHNHITRDIKKKGICPGCDEYHARHPVVKQPKPSELPPAPTQSRRVPVSSSYNPERYVSFRVLWAKVIIRAAYDYALWKESRDMRLKKFADDAARWLFESSNMELSFENICFAFDFPVERIRTRTRALTKADVKKLEFRERHGRIEAPVEELTGGEDE